jgi:16S rRNA (guanine1207-N2)-methyltransferase
VTDDYYEWREFETRIADRVIRYASKPGLPDWDQVDHASRLLAEAIGVGPGDRLIDLRCGKGIVAAFAAQRGADVTALDDSIVAVEATRRTLEMNAVLPADVRLSSYDIAVITVPKSRDATRRLIREAARALRPGGRAYLAGATRSGVKSAIDDLKSIFGSAHVVAYGKGHRVAVSTRPDVLAPDDEDGFAEIEVEARGGRWHVVTGPGVFSRDRLDDGTRHLIEATEFRAGESLLDLGCGCGIVGLVGAVMGSRVTCVDGSAAAIEATRRTLSIAGTHDAHVVWSDCASAVRDRQFDVVATNPPFHQGVGADFAVARQFARDAAHVLRPAGRLVLVANRFLRYERELSHLFAQVRVVFEDGRFRVLEAVKQA